MASSALDGRSVVLRQQLRQMRERGDGGSKLVAMASLVRNHEHFKSLLQEISGEARQDFYDTLRPHLTFTAKPLDVYIAEAGQQAEREQLTTLDAEGRFQPFKSAHDVRSLEAHAEKAIAAALAERTLTLVCGKCLAEESFCGLEGETRVAIIMKARHAGWIYDYKAKVPIEICPNCPTSLRKTE